MNGKFYAISVNPGERTVPIEAIQGALGKTDWLRVNFNQWFLYSDQNAEDIWKALMPVLNPADLLLVAEIIPSNAWATVHPVINEWFARARY